MNRDDCLSKFLLHWQQEERCGRDLSAAELCRECPELEAELAEQIDVLRHMNALVLLRRELVVDSISPTGLAHEVKSAVKSVLGDSESECTSRRLPAIPGYEIQDEIGRGGMGVVYRARQVKLNRTVALKLILSAAHAGAEAKARFVQEAETIARLKHANIVQIYEFGNHEGDAFFSLEFIEGGTLANRLRGEPQPPLQAAGTVETLSRAIQSAHEQKVIHRDLKPGNVLMTLDGVPKVTDFGLAKQIDSAMTATGAVMGTPSYMAPEQAAGNTKDVGPATDIYALGAILYEMLTGRPPFKGVSAWDTMQMAITADPVPPRQLNAQVPRDLETICLKCLHKEPGRRYRCATELADDLRRFQSGEPIQARPVGTGERIWKWACRRPAVAALIAIVLIASSIFLGLGFWFSAEMGAASAAIKTKEERAKDAERLAQTHEFFGLLRAAGKRSVQPQPGWTWANVQDLSKASRLTPAIEHVAELRSEAAATLGAMDARPFASVGEGQSAASLAFHPEGNILALGPFTAPLLITGRVELIDVRKRTVFRTLNFDPAFVLDPAFGVVPDGIFSLAFSPDGRFLVAGARSGKLHCWDLSRESPAAVSWDAHSRSIRTLCFSLDGLTLYTAGGGDDKMVKSWTCHDLGKPGLPPRCGHAWKASFNIEQIAVHPTEGWLICGMIGDHGQCLSGEMLQPIRSQMDVCGRLCFAPHGDAIMDGDLHLTGLRSNRVLRAFSLPDGESVYVSSLAFNKQGTMLVTVSNSSKKVYLWEVASGRLVTELFVGDGKLIVAGFSPDGRLLAVTADSKTLLFEVGGLSEQTFSAVQPLPILSFGLDPDGRTLACQSLSCWRGDYSDVTIWPLDEESSVRPRARHTSSGSEIESPSVCFQPGRQRLAWISSGKLNFQDTVGLTQRQSLPTAKDGKSSFEGGLNFGADGRIWGTTGPELRVWETTEFTKGLSWDTGWKGTLSGLAALYSVDIGRRWAAVGGRDGAVYLFDAYAKKSLSPVREIPAFKSPVRAVALNKDESLLATGSDKGDLSILAVPKGSVLTKETPHLQGVKALSWSAHGLLASGSHDRTVKIWSCTDGALQELFTLRQTGPVRWLAFHPDGVRLFVLLERESAVRVWHFDRLLARLEDMGLGTGLSPTRKIPLPPLAPVVPPDQPIIEPPSSSNGLKAELYDDMELQRCVKIRYDAKIDQRWGNKAPDPLLPTREFSMRWTGWLKAPNPGKYTLQLESDEGARLWLDGKRLIDRWQSAAGKLQVEVELTGQPQALRIELMNLGGSAFIHFRWAQKGKAMQTVPYEALFHEAMSKCGKDEL